MKLCRRISTEILLWKFSILYLHPLLNSFINTSYFTGYHRKHILLISFAFRWRASLLWMVWTPIWHNTTLQIKIASRYVADRKNNIAKLPWFTPAGIPFAMVIIYQAVVKRSLEQKYKDETGARSRVTSYHGHFISRHSLHPLLSINTIEFWIANYSRWLSRASKLRDSLWK